MSTATHYVIEGPGGVLTCEKLRPMLRALFPKKEEKEIQKMAGLVYQISMMSTEEYEAGLKVNGGEYVIFRRVNEHLYDELAISVTAGNASPFADEAELFARLHGRTCLH